jgi:hypothetical protein
VCANATLADLFTPLLFADLSSAVWVSRSDGLRMRATMVDARPAGWAEVVARRFFFSPRLGKTAVLQEGASNHRHKSVTMKTVPGQFLEVIETEFLFQL